MAEFRKYQAAHGEREGRFSGRIADMVRQPSFVLPEEKRQENDGVERYYRRQAACLSSGECYTKPAGCRQYDCTILVGHSRDIGKSASQEFENSE